LHQLIFFKNHKIEFSSSDNNNIYLHTCTSTYTYDNILSRSTAYNFNIIPIFDSLFIIFIFIFMKNNNKILCYYAQNRKLLFFHFSMNSLHVFCHIY